MADVKISLKLAADKFKNGLKSAQAALKGFANSVQKIDKAFSFGKNITKTTKEIEKDFLKASASVNKYRNDLKLAASESKNLAKKSGLNDFKRAVSSAFGLAAIGNFIKSIGSVGSAFQNQMAKVKAITNSSSSDFEMMRKEAKRLGETTMYTATQAAEALENLTRNGLSAKDATKSLAGTLKLAQSQSIGLAEAADIATASMNGFGKGAKDLDNIVDILASTASHSATAVGALSEALKEAAPVAKTMNISMEETNAALGTLANVGIKGGAAGTSLKIMLQRLSSQVPKAQKVLQKYNLTLNESVIKQKGLAETLKMLKMSGVANSLADMSELFGKEASPSISALINNVSQFDSLRSTLYSSKGEADRMASTGVGEMKKSLDILISTWESFQNKIFEKSSKLFSGAIKGLTDFIKHFQSLPNIIADVVSIISITFGRYWREFSKDYDFSKIAGAGLKELEGKLDFTNIKTSQLERVAFVVDKLEKSLAGTGTEGEKAIYRIKNALDKFKASTHGIDVNLFGSFANDARKRGLFSGIDDLILGGKGKSILSILGFKGPGLTEEDARTVSSALGELKSEYEKALIDLEQTAKKRKVSPIDIEEYRKAIFGISQAQEQLATATQKSSEPLSEESTFFDSINKKVDALKNNLKTLFDTITSSANSVRAEKLIDPSAITDLSAVRLSLEKEIEEIRGKIEKISAKDFFSDNYKEEVSELMENLSGQILKAIEKIKTSLASGERISLSDFFESGGLIEKIREEIKKVNTSAESSSSPSPLEGTIKATEKSGEELTKKIEEIANKASEASSKAFEEIDKRFEDSANKTTESVGKITDSIEKAEEEFHKSVSSYSKSASSSPINGQRTAEQIKKDEELLKKTIKKAEERVQEALNNYNDKISFGNYTYEEKKEIRKEFKNEYNSAIVDLNKLKASFSSTRGEVESEWEKFNQQLISLKNGTINVIEDVENEFVRELHDLNNNIPLPDSRKKWGKDGSYSWYEVSDLEEWRDELVGAIDKNYSDIETAWRKANGLLEEATNDYSSLREDKSLVTFDKIWDNSIIQSLGNATSAAINVLKHFVQTIVKLFTGDWDSVKQSLGHTLRYAIDFAVEVIRAGGTALAGAIATLGPIVIAAIKESFDEGSLGTAFADLGGQIEKYLRAVADYLVEKIPVIYGQIKEALTGENLANDNVFINAFQRIKNAVANFWEAIKPYLQKIKEGFQAIRIDISEWWDENGREKVAKFLEGVLEKFKVWIADFKEKLKEIGIKIKDWFEMDHPKLTEFFHAFEESVLTALNKIIPGFDQFRERVAETYDNFKKLKDLTDSIDTEKATIAVQVDSTPVIRELGKIEKSSNKTFRKLTSLFKSLPSTVLNGIKGAGSYIYNMLGGWQGMLFSAISQSIAYVKNYFDELGRELKEAKKRIIDTNTANATMQSSFLSLTKIMNGTTKGSSEWKTALQQLKSEYPDLISKLGSEFEQISKNSDAYERLKGRIMDVINAQRNYNLALSKGEANKSLQEAYFNSESGRTSILPSWLAGKGGYNKGTYGALLEEFKGVLKSGNASFKGVDKETADGLVKALDAGIKRILVSGGGAKEIDELLATSGYKSSGKGKSFGDLFYEGYQRNVVKTQSAVEKVYQSSKTAPNDSINVLKNDITAAVSEFKQEVANLTKSGKASGLSQEQIDSSILSAGQNIIQKVVGEASNHLYESGIKKGKTNILYEGTDYLTKSKEWNDLLSSINKYDHSNDVKSGGIDGSSSSTKTEKTKAEKIKEAEDNYSKALDLLAKEKEQEILSEKEYNNSRLSALQSYISTLESIATSEGNATADDISAIKLLATARKELEDTIKKAEEAEQKEADRLEKIKNYSEDQTKNNRDINKEYSSIKDGSSLNKLNKWDLEWTGKNKDEMSFEYLTDQLESLKSLRDSISDDDIDLAKEILGEDENNKQAKELLGLIEEIEKSINNLSSATQSLDDKIHINQLREQVKELKKDLGNSLYEGVKNLTGGVVSLVDSFKSIGEAEDDWEGFTAVINSIFSTIDWLISMFETFKTVMETVGEIGGLKKLADTSALASAQTVAAIEAEAAAITTGEAQKATAVATGEAAQTAAIVAADNAQAASSIESKALEAGSVLPMNASMIASEQTLMATRAAAASASLGPLAPAAAAGEIAALEAIIAAAKLVPAFANGGVVGGTRYNGDKNLVRVNSGEVILNKKQQNRLYDLATSGKSTGSSNNGGNETLTMRIRGKELVAAINNYKKTSTKFR